MLKKDLEACLRAAERLTGTLGAENAQLRNDKRQLTAEVDRLNEIINIIGAVAGWTGGYRGRVGS